MYFPTDDSKLPVVLDWNISNDSVKPDIDYELNPFFAAKKHLTKCYPFDGLRDLVTNKKGVIDGGTGSVKVSNGFLSSIGTGDPDALDCGTDPYHNGELSVFVVFKAPDISAIRQICAADNSNDTNREFQFRLDSGGEIRLITFQGGATRQIASTETFDDNCWHVASFGCRDGEQFVIVDGKIVASAAGANALDLDGARFTIAGRSQRTTFNDPATNEEFVGDIALVYSLDSALNKAQHIAIGKEVNRAIRPKMPARYPRQKPGGYFIPDRRAESLHWGEDKNYNVDGREHEIDFDHPLANKIYFSLSPHDLSGRDLVSGRLPTTRGGAIDHRNGALFFTDGANSYLEYDYQDLIDLPVGGGITIAMRCRVTSFRGDSALVAWHGTDDLLLYPFDNSGGDGLRWFWRDCGGSSGKTATESTGRFFNVVWRCDKTGFMSTVIDGVEVYTENNNITGAGPFSGFRVGNWGDNTSQRFVGWVDTVHIWKRFLNLTECKDLNNARAFLVPK